MKLLAIDTSTDFLSVAVVSDGKTLGRVHKKVPRAHSSLLMPTIDSVLKKAKTPLKKIDGFALSVGPGSFTGLRIGVTTVKGLAFVTEKPVVAVPTLDAIAENGRKFCGILCAILDARKNKVYACIYKSDGKAVKKVSKSLLVPVAELLELLKKHDSVAFIGDYAERIVGQLPGAKIATDKWEPRPEVIADIGAELFEKKKFIKVQNLEPLYIYTRECDITGK